MKYKKIYNIQLKVLIKLTENLRIIIIILQVNLCKVF